MNPPQKIRTDTKHSKYKVPWLGSHRTELIKRITVKFMISVKINSNPYSYIFTVCLFSETIFLFTKKSAILFRYIYSFFPLVICRITVFYFYFNTLYAFGILQDVFGINSNQNITYKKSFIFAVLYDSLIFLCEFTHIFLQNHEQFYLFWSFQFRIFLHHQGGHRITYKNVQIAILKINPDSQFLFFRETCGFISIIHQVSHQYAKIALR